MNKQDSGDPTSVLILYPQPQVVWLMSKENHCFSPNVVIIFAEVTEATGEPAEDGLADYDNINEIYDHHSKLFPF